MKIGWREKSRCSSEKGLLSGTGVKRKKEKKGLNGVESAERAKEREKKG